MGRPAIPLGTHGAIWTTPAASGGVTATTKFRDYDGKLRPVEATRKTKTTAINALKEALRDRAEPGDRQAPVTRDTRIRELLPMWLEHHRSTPMPNGHMRSAATMEYYEAPVTRLSERIGDLRLSEATTAVLELALGSGTAAQWRGDRKTLNLAFAYAVRMGALPFNPVTGTTSAPGSRKRARALTIEELRMIRGRITEWQGESKYGPRRMPELGHIVDVMLGTGLRISDVLGLLVEDLDLEADPPTLTAQVQKSRGEQMTLVLPSFTVDAIKAQLERGMPSDEGLVFPTRNGTRFTRHNVATRLREALSGDESLTWVSSHNFRKTAATLVEREYGIDRASKQLGHSGVAVTERHYIERAKVAPDNRGALDKLAPLTASDPLGP